ncbi:MAG TPA: PilC/PilY family type IV pilus protein [Steroidobacteraceae bacterium]|nr:PilC/PilY family type IV pilus protein [Steroidobacteraceae bacterium]
MKPNLRVWVLLAVAAFAPNYAWSQLIVSEDFTGASATNSWTPYLGACLTAGNGSGSIPACVGDSYYSGQTQVGGYSGTLPDPVGDGALRFTNGYPYYNQAGGIISNFTYPSSEGLEVTFKTVTYLGNSGGSGADGADGMSFFLLDGSAPAPYAGEFDVGAFGGSLGYTCSNTNNDSKLHPNGFVRHYDGVVAGYLGLGIDEYGNFLNQGDNTASGYGYQPDRIGLRGAGSINWYSLNNEFPTYYPGTGLKSTQQAQAVQQTCETGYAWDYSNPAQPVETTTKVMDYPAIANAYKVLSGSLLIANESAKTRPQAEPITYDLKITQNGLLSLAYSYNGGAYQPVITDQSITAGNGPLPSSFRFGFAGSTGGSDNVHEILCFKAQPADVASTSVGVNEKEASKIATGTQAFLAYYYPTTWAGRLTANNLLYDSSTNLISIDPVANWDASCVLTGVPSGQTCPTTGGGSMPAEAPSSRTMLTWNGAQGIPFEWSSLTTAQQDALDNGDPTPYTADRLNYLRGDRSNEITTTGSGLYRDRASVLGDIVDSSPTWVGPPSAPYSIVWKDDLYPANSNPENGTDTYPDFISAEQTRLNVVYAGSNDGFVHGFRAGAFDSSGNFVNDSATPNDGEEVLAYMPNAVLQEIHNSSNGALDFSNPQYAHNFYVDATPDAEDLFYEGAWHTWLVGGLGPGGSAIYALDVTNPSSFSESNAANVVIGEWTPSTITCANVSNCGQDLGDTYGTPEIRRLHNGMWAVIFGNGYGSASGDAGIFVMTIDQTTGAKTFYYFSTGESGKNDGIDYPSAADFDGDHITDFVYAGDLLGNVWRLNLTSSNPANWHMTPAPIFTDPAGNPITTKVTVSFTPPSQGTPRVILNFGTGRKIPLTLTSPDQYATGTQHLYGIWDSDMASWNALNSVMYASLSTPPQSISLSLLQQQTLTLNPSTGVLDGTNNPICWADQTNCSSTPQYGWYIVLPGPNEQVIYNPLTYGSAFIVNTTIPPDDSPLNCAAATETGDTIVVSINTGGVIKNVFPDYTDASAAGEMVNGVGTPFVLLAGGSAQLITQTVSSNSGTSSGGTTSGGTSGGGPLHCSGQLCSTPLNPNGPTGRRVTWTELR